MVLVKLHRMFVFLMLWGLNGIAMGQANNHMSLSFHSESSIQNLKWHNSTEFGNANYRIGYNHVAYALRLWWSHPISHSREIGFFTSYAHTTLDDGKNGQPAKYIGNVYLNGHLLQQSQYDSLKWYRTGIRLSAGFNEIGMFQVDGFLYDYTSLKRANIFGHGFNAFIEHSLSFQRKGIPLPPYLGLEYGFSFYKFNKVHFQKSNDTEAVVGRLSNLYISANVGWNF
jgi:hypothetical protein